MLFSKSSGGLIQKARNIESRNREKCKSGIFGLVYAEGPLKIVGLRCMRIPS